MFDMLYSLIPASIFLVFVVGLIVGKKFGMDIGTSNLEGEISSDGRGQLNMRITRKGKLVDAKTYTITREMWEGIGRAKGWTSTTYSSSQPNTARWWEILGVDVRATEEQIVAAYRKLAKMYHPDNQKTGNEKYFKAINTAKDNGVKYAKAR